MRKIILSLCYCLLLVTALSCSSTVKTNENKKEKSSPAFKIKSLKSNCSKGKVLSCAKLAYLYERDQKASLAYKYYDKACKMKHEVSCFNLKSLNPQNIYFEKFENLMKFHSRSIINCHSMNYSIDKTKASVTQLEEKWERVILSIHIDPRGRASARGVSVASTLSNSFKACTRKVISKIKFPSPPKNISPLFKYGLMMGVYQ